MARPPEASVTSVELELECPLCLELLREPVILPCSAGHNICVGCAGARVVFDRRAGRVTCPMCREARPLASLDDLKRNMVLRNVVESYRRELGAISARPAEGRREEAARRRAACLCTVCDAGDEAAPAAFQCAACVALFCDECAERRPHPPPGVAHAAHAGHRLLPVTTAGGDDSGAPPAAAPLHLCADHPQYALDLFCRQCAVPACAHCLLVGAHRDHDRTEAADAAAGERAAVEAEAAALAAREAELGALSDTLEALRDRIRENGAAKRAEVAEAFARLRRDLDAREEAMLRAADLAVAEREQAIADQRARLAETAELAAAARKRAEGELAEAGADAVLLLLRAPAARARLASSRRVCFRPEEPAVRLPSLGLTVYRPRLAAAVRAFDYEQAVRDAHAGRSLEAGQWVDCRDSVGRWQRATVAGLKRQRLSGVEVAKIHFDGWSSRWDEWVPVASSRIEPYGLVTGDMDPADHKGDGPRPGDNLGGGRTQPG